MLDYAGYENFAGKTAAAGTYRMAGLDVDVGNLDIDMRLAAIGWVGRSALVAAANIVAGVRHQNDCVDSWCAMTINKGASTVQYAK